MKLPFNQKGFTIQELMVTIFVSSLLGLLVISVFLSANRFFNITRYDVDIQTEISRIINLFEQDVRGADSVSEYPLGNPTVTSDRNELVVRALSLESDGDVMPTTYDYFIYTLSGTGPYTLTREVVANGDGRTSSTTVLSTNISNLSFFYNNTPVTEATAVSVEVQLTKEYDNLERILTSRSVITLRN